MSTSNFLQRPHLVRLLSFHPNLLNGPYSGLSLHIVRIDKDEKIQEDFRQILPKAAALRDSYIKELLNKI